LTVSGTCGSLLDREVAERGADGRLELRPVRLKVLAALFGQADDRATAVNGIRRPRDKALRNQRRDQ